MRRTARFLLYTLRPYLLILPISVTGAILLLPRIAGGTDGPVAALCNALPSFGLLFLLMQGVNLAISALPLALSLGGRRRDLLLGVQLCALLGAGAAVLPWLLPLPALETIPSSLWPRGLLPLFLLLSLPVSAALLEFPLFRALARLSVR